MPGEKAGRETWAGTAVLLVLVWGPLLTTSRPQCTPGQGLVVRNERDIPQGVGLGSCLLPGTVSTGFLRCTKELLMQIMEDCSIVLSPMLGGCPKASGFLTKTVELQAVGTFEGSMSAAIQVMLVQGRAPQELLVRFFWGKGACTAYYAMKTPLQLSYQHFTSEVDTKYYSKGFACESGTNFLALGVQGQETARVTGDGCSKGLSSALGYHFPPCTTRFKLSIQADCTGTLVSETCLGLVLNLKVQRVASKGIYDFNGSGTTNAVLIGSTADAKIILTGSNTEQDILGTSQTFADLAIAFTTTEAAAASARGPPAAASACILHYVKEGGPSQPLIFLRSDESIRAAAAALGGMHGSAAAAAVAALPPAVPVRRNDKVAMPSGIAITYEAIDANRPYKLMHALEVQRALQPERANAPSPGTLLPQQHDDHLFEAQPGGSDVIFEAPGGSDVIFSNSAWKESGAVRGLPSLLLIAAASLALYLGS